MRKHQVNIINAKDLAEDIEILAKDLETLANGQEGFLKDLRKTTQDIGVQRFNEDVFMLKNLAKHVFEILNYIERTQVGSDNEVDSNGDKY